MMISKCNDYNYRKIDVIPTNYWNINVTITLYVTDPFFRIRMWTYLSAITSSSCLKRSIELLLLLKIFLNCIIYFYPWLVLIL